MSAASNAKTVELFRDLLPSVRRVGVLSTTASSVFAKAMVDEVVRAARADRHRNTANRDNQRT
jgi:ABC-type uncharacterized transport system substrate-binding protein